MCPVCLSTAALVLTGKASAGGFAALAANRLRRGWKRRNATAVNQETPTKEEPKMNQPKVTSRTEWLAARRALLAKEKELTRQRDAVSEARRSLPAVKVDEDYVFESSSGPVRLVDLFGKHDQLIIYHFMFHPDWEQGCKSCSHFMDNSQGAIVHLAARNTAFAVVSRAPVEKIEKFKKRMGWNFRWVSSFGNSFNYDFHVSLDPDRGSTEYNYANAAELVKAHKLWSDRGELPGLSVFVRRGSEIFHTYSTYQRGLDLPLNTYNFLDLTPLGRQEENDHVQGWIRLHDSYGSDAA
jgi:predicted dithiol-disulfide oxidoreductase (DUF899 family)